MSKTMAELNCLSFRIQFEFDEKVFNTKKFRKIANIDPEYSVNVAVMANSEDPNRDEHLHVVLDLDGADSSLTLSYHQGALDFEELEVARVISSEQRIRELASVFKVKRLSGSTVSKFAFSEEFEPLIFLGYPISGLESPLEDALVTGQQLTFGKGASKKKVFISSDRGCVSVVVNGTRNVVLESLRPETLVAKDGQIADALVIESKYIESEYVDS